jgi:hypothetical protein
VTRAGIACAIVAAASTFAVTRLSNAPPAPLQVFAGERILAADFHVHAYPGDGALLPWDLARAAADARLDVIAITSHNQMLGIHHTAPLDTPFGVLLIAGEEITMPRVHIAAIGLTSPVDWHGSIEDIVAAVHAQGGVAIAAHPTRASREAWDDQALRAVDGIEAAHPSMLLSPVDRADLAASYAEARRVHPTIAPIGSSDFHTAQPLGWCRTYVFVRQANTIGVLDAIRRGRTVACAADGSVTGEASLAAAVSDACRTAATRAARPEMTPSRLATLLAWIGLAGLAFLGVA